MLRYTDIEEQDHLEFDSNKIYNDILDQQEKYERQPDRLGGLEVCMQNEAGDICIEKLYVNYFCKLTFEYQVKL